LPNVYENSGNFLPQSRIICLGVSMYKESPATIGTKKEKGIYPSNERSEAQ